MSESAARWRTDAVQDEGQQSFVSLQAGVARHAHAADQLHEVGGVDVVSGIACLLGAFQHQSRRDPNLFPRGGRQVQYSGYKIVVDSIASPTGNYPFPTEWADLFGVPQVGDRAFLRVFKQDDQGMRSMYWSDYESYA